MEIVVTKTMLRFLWWFRFPMKKPETIIGVCNAKNDGDSLAAEGSFTKRPHIRMANKSIMFSREI